MTNAKETQTQPTENSVLFALRELTALEADREQRERAAKAAEHEAREAARRAQAEAEATRLAAEAAQREADAQKLVIEARARAEAEAERDLRMATMRAQLASIEAERAQLRAELVSRHQTPEPRRGYGLAFGLSSVVAAALAGLLVMQANARPVAPVAAPVSHEDVSAHREVADEPVGAEVAAEVALPEPALVEVPSVSPRPIRHRPERPVHGVDHGTDHHTDHGPDLGLDFGDEDGLLPTDAHRAR